MKASMFNSKAPYLHSFALFLFTSSILWITPGQSAEKPIWIESEGEAYQSEVETPKEVRERARKDAQNRAVERAVGVFIKSHTLVFNSQLAEDLIYASARGKIEQVEVLQEGWDAKDRNLYRVKLKALIQPVFPEKGQGLSLKASLSKTALKEGEEVKIFFQVSHECYIYVFSVAADGSVTLLLPNQGNPDHRIQAGTGYVFPFDGKIKLQARLLPGYQKAEERIKIIVTKKREDLIPLGFQEGYFKVYDAKSTGMISDLVKKLTLLEPTDWTEANLVYLLEK
jgi:hypothetical protein